MTIMKHFSMPADFKKETIDRYEELNLEYENSRIIEIYGNITVDNTMTSGRVISQLPAVDLSDLEVFIEYSRRKNIEFNYTLNGTHLQNKEFTLQGVTEIKEFLKSIYEAGVRRLTVALPSLLEIVLSTSYDFSIKASTLCQITNANKAQAFRDMGVERIVVDESINRDFWVLKKIRAVFGEKVEIIINPLCLKDCIYRMFHYHQISGDSVGSSNEISANYYEHRCVMQRYKNISNLLRMCWVRPEDLSYYTDIGINYFKIQGRQSVFKGDAVKTAKIYFQGNYDGDLLDLLYMFYPLNSFRVFLDNKKLEGFIKPFAEKEGFCRRDCSHCGYCDDFVSKIIDYTKAEKIIGLANKFYSEYDKFNNMVESVNIEDEVTGKQKNLNVDFDI